MGWRICQWARLRDGDHALKLLDTQLRTVEGRNPQRESGNGAMNYSNGGGTYLNLFDAHPPFQIVPLSKVSLATPPRKPQ